MILAPMKRFTSAILAVSLCSALACGKKDSDDATTDDSAATTTDSETVNALAAAFPDQLALSVFPTGSTSLNIEGEEYTNKTQDEMLKENDKILRGEADNCMDRDLFKQARPDSKEMCYEFDSDMNPTKIADRPGKEWGTKTGKNADGEACLVAFMREEANKSILTVQKALAMVRGMICQAKRRAAANGDTLEMPKAGEELNLKKDMADAAGSKMAVSEAKIEAVETTSLADGSDDTHYVSTVKMKDPNGKEMEVYLTNQHTTDGEKGLLSFKRPANAERVPANDQNNTINKNDLLSIAYEFSGKDSDKNAKVKVRVGAILKDIESFNSDGMVNLEGVPEADGNSSLHMVTFIDFDINPETSAGRFAYWRNPGGGYNEPARGFIFNVAEKDGVLSGCGLSGRAGMSVRKAFATESDLEPIGWWHPQWSQNTSADKDTTSYPTSEGDKVTKQCFKQNADGLYEITTTGTRGYEMVKPADSGIKAPRAFEAKLPPPPPAVVK